MQLLLGPKRQEVTPLKRSPSNNINDSMLSGPLTPQHQWTMERKKSYLPKSNNKICHNRYQSFEVFYSRHA